jgi:hypothetical protein
MVASGTPGRRRSLYDAQRRKAGRRSSKLRVLHRVQLLEREQECAFIVKLSVEDFEVLRGVKEDDRAV